MKVPEQAAELSSSVLFAESVSLHRVELASEALAVWRQYSELEPTLLLLSDEPMLLPLPLELRSKALPWIVDATQGELQQRSLSSSPDILFFPDMTVDIALRSDWLGGVHWLVPLRDENQDLRPERFRDRLGELGLATAEEIATIQGDALKIHGQLRNHPFAATTLDNLPEVDEPVLLHIDLSYFRTLYKNEMAEPLLDIVIRAMNKLREQQVPVLAVTLSYGNLTGRIAPDVRFVGEILARMIEQPEVFSGEVPENWQRQGKILYLRDFFQNDAVHEIALTMEQDDPNGAWPKFTLYQSAATLKEGKQALDYLSQAVAIDPVYAVEYLHLAEMAFDKGRPDETMRMLKYASVAFPENPMIRLKIAQLASDLGDKETALHLVEQIRKLNWSKLYFPDMPEYLDGFIAFLEGEEKRAPSIPQSNPADDPRRQRILK